MRKNKTPNNMTGEKTLKTSWIKIRVTPQEKLLLVQKAALQGMSLTDFIRVRTLNYRQRQHPLSKEYLFQLARIGVNLNQLAKWANTYKSKTEALEVVLALADFEKELHALHIREE